jgi:preprotein translocase SecF subunit
MDYNNSNKKMIALNISFKFIDFFSYRRYGFLFSICITVATIAGYLLWGINLGIDFKGGIITEISPSNEALAQKIKTGLLQKDADITIQKSGKNIILRFQNPSTQYSTKSVDSIKNITLQIDKDAEFIKIDYVGPKVTKDLASKAILASFWALFVMMVYILIRFNWKFSVVAITSLFHDMVASIGFFIFTRYEFDLTSIAAILTIIGYSINDSVVIFDRIRENMHDKQRLMTPQIVNQSINETLSRTVLTFLTTFAACIALWGFGGEGLKSFSAVITFGVAFGTYSSIFISGNLLPYLK